MDITSRWGGGWPSVWVIPPDLLDRLPAGAVESFAGVGYFFDLADLVGGERVIDLGSGSGMDALAAALAVGPSGRVLAVDLTVEQLNKARDLAARAILDHVEFTEGRIESLPAADESLDCVISNGVINLSPRKERVFAEAARVLRPGGRIAVADIVTERQLADAIVANVRPVGVLHRWRRPAGGRSSLSSPAECPGGRECTTPSGRFFEPLSGQRQSRR